MALKNEYLRAIIIYEFQKRTKIINAVKTICDAFGETTVSIRVKDNTQTSNAVILTSRSLDKFRAGRSVAVDNDSICGKFTNFTRLHKSNLNIIIQSLITN